MIKSMFSLAISLLQTVSLLLEMYEFSNSRRDEILVRNGSLQLKAAISAFLKGQFKTARQFNQSAVNYLNMLDNLD